MQQRPVWHGEHSYPGGCAAPDHPEVITLALLAAGQRIAELEGPKKGEQPSPSTPSGMVPVYTKPNTPKRHQKPGATAGHPGVRRERPVKIDERKTHRLTCCPHCEGKLQRCERSRTRIIEDVPEVIEPVVTEHTIHRDYCPRSKKHVEPVVPDAMPKATLGHRPVVLIRACRASGGTSPRASARGPDSAPNQQNDV